MYRVNNLPELKISTAPQSDKVIAKMTEAMNLSSRQAQQTELQDQRESQPVQPAKSQETQAETMETGTGKPASEPVKCKKQERKQRKSLTRINGVDIGLNIYTPRSKGWAEVPLRKNSLLRGIEEKHIK